MLHNLQHTLQQHFLKQEGASLPSHDIVSGQMVERLTIYQNNIFVSLKKALHTTFPITAELVDMAYFRYITEEYIKAHPPTSGCLFEYGEKFHEFLQNHPSAQSYTFLYDVARLEWAVHQCEHAENDAALKGLSLAHITEDDMENLRFKAVGRACLMAFDCAAVLLYNNIQSQGGFNAEEIALTKNEYALIWRDKSYDCQVQGLSKGVYGAMQALFDGKTLRDIAEKNDGDALEQALTLALQHQLIVRRDDHEQ